MRKKARSYKFSLIILLLLSFLLVIFLLIANNKRKQINIIELGKSIKRLYIINLILIHV